MINYEYESKACGEIIVKAKEKNQTLGFIQYYNLSEKQNTILDLRVIKEYRNQGIARGLLDLVEENGKEIILTHVVKDAENFWENRGYNLRRNGIYTEGIKKVKSKKKQYF